MRPNGPGRRTGPTATRSLPVRQRRRPTVPKAQSTGFQLEVTGRLLSPGWAPNGPWPGPARDRRMICLLAAAARMPLTGRLAVRVSPAWSTTDTMQVTRRASDNASAAAAAPPPRPPVIPAALPSVIQSQGRLREASPHHLLPYLQTPEPRFFLNISAYPRS